MRPSEGKRSGCKENRKGCKAVLHLEGTCAESVSNGVCFSSVSPGVMMEEGETHME